MKVQLVKHSTGYILFDEKGIPIGATPNVLSNGTFSKLSLKNCQAIERGYDVYDLAKENYHKFWSVVDESEMLDHTFGYVEGFQKAVELMGDKKFSEEDMKSIFEYGWNQRHYDVMDENKLERIKNRYIQSLQQTEWDVEIVEFKADDLKSIHNEWYKLGEPKLDADGCLILKLKSE